MRRTVWPAIAAPFGAALGIAVVIAGYRARYVKKVVQFRGRDVKIDDETS
jgi:hypothetical protein